MIKNNNDNNNHNNEWLILSNLNKDETIMDLFLLLMSILSETFFITHTNIHLNKFVGIIFHPFEERI